MVWRRGENAVKSESNKKETKHTKGRHVRTHHKAKILRAYFVTFAVVKMKTRRKVQWQSQPPKIETIKKSDRRWQSDIIVDMIKRYGFEYIALNPGASYRGLHDSLVNYGENDPPMLLCQHEKIAVQIAHGYARAKGKPMIAIVHNLVGLLARARWASTTPISIARRSLSSAPPGPWPSPNAVPLLTGSTRPMAKAK